MKKIRQFFIIWIVAIIATTYSFAVVDDGVGSIDQECQANGFDYGIAKYQCGSTTPDAGYDSTFTLTVSWTQTNTDCISADWTADPAVAGVLSKEGTPTYVHPGGTSGTVTNTTQQSISHITFCGSENGAPEFLTPAIALAVLLTTPAFAYLVVKRRNRR